LTRDICCFYCTDSTQKPRFAEKLGGSAKTEFSKHFRKKNPRKRPIRCAKALENLPLILSAVEKNGIFSGSATDYTKFFIINRFIKSETCCGKGQFPRDLTLV